MKKICAALLLVGLILFSSTPALANYFPVISDSGTAFVLGGALLCLGIIGNRRFMKR